MKRSKVPFTVTFNRFLDFGHKSAVVAMAGGCAVAFILITYEALHMKYVRHPELKKKEQEMLSRSGETI